MVSLSLIRQIHQKLRGATRSTTEHFSEKRLFLSSRWDLALMHASSLIVAMDRNYSYLVILPPQRNHYGSAVTVVLHCTFTNRGGTPICGGLAALPVFVAEFVVRLVLSPYYKKVHHACLSTMEG
ncbi:hypothetical protein V6N13_136651 [Hibiscus sabdariffa]